MTIYHNHHIIPRHAGGTDESSNLVKLTIEDHAEAHRLLYEEHGRWQDFIAWKTLSNQMTIAEARIEAVKRALTGKTQSPEHVAKRTYKGIKRKPASEERKRKMSHLHKTSGHAPSAEAYARSAEANRGSFWATDGINNKKLRKNEPIPEGWYKGRTFNLHLPLTVTQQ